MFYEHMMTELNRLKNHTNRLKQNLTSYPAGKLIFVNNSGYTKWFISDGHTSKYIPKKQKSLAQKLAQKAYLEAQINDLEAEQEAISLYLDYCDTNANHLANLLTNPNILNLYSESTNSSSSIISSESNSTYKCYSTNAKLFLPNEKIIVQQLWEYNIPFQYKVPLVFSDITYYPTFTLTHPQTNKHIYLEVFDSVNDSIYRTNIYHKLDCYAAHDILPGKNLITVYCSEDTAIEPLYIRSQLEYFFL